MPDPDHAAELDEIRRDAEKLLAARPWTGLEHTVARHALRLANEVRELRAEVDRLRAEPYQDSADLPTQTGNEVIHERRVGRVVKHSTTPPFELPED